jgi:predicted nuclease of restriction endonuclease-like (RecB) superfamily
MTEKRKKRELNKDTKGVTMPVPVSSSELPADYPEFLVEIKSLIGRERLKTLQAANKALVILYWNVGKAILEKQKRAGWGAKVIDRLSFDLKEAFPDMSGFSPRNLKYMRKFAAEWPKLAIVQEVLAQISWYHNLALLEKIKDEKTRIWYAKQAKINGWSRNILTLQIESNLHKRIGQTANNFDIALPPEDSDMAKQIFKDPYLFDFVGTGEIRRERELELKLVGHLEKFLLELGQGFAFVGRQVLIEFEDQEYRIDLLFYHLKLRCYVVIELKAGKFKAEHVSKLNMYMNIVDDLMCHPDDKKTIGLLLVKEKNHTLAKYALSGYTNPIGVAEWEKQITDSLPDDLKSSLPTIEEIEAELEGVDYEFPERSEVSKTSDDSETSELSEKNTPSNGGTL